MQNKGYKASIVPSFLYHLPTAVEHTLQIMSPNLELRFLKLFLAKPRSRKKVAFKIYGIASFYSSSGKRKQLQMEAHIS